MRCLTVLYPNKDGAKFDFDYYMKKHIPMVSRLLNSKIDVSKGMPLSNGSSSPFLCIGRIWIPSLPEFDIAMEKHGAEITQDIHNYTNVEPVLLMEETVA
jgi:uncharacterized protein (TIGR02118 family)